MEASEIIGIVFGSITALVALYYGAREGIKVLGAAIPGDDPVERFGRMLEAKVDPIAKLITDGVDKLNPKTNGGAGNGHPEAG